MYTKLIDTMGTDQAQEIGKLAEFNREATPVSDFIAKRTGELITQIDGTTKNQIKDIILKAANKGESLNSVADTIKAKFEQFKSSRATMIAVTETTAAYGFSAREAMSQAGIDQSVWLTTMDGHERPAHAALNGQVSDSNGLFTVDGASTAYPGGFGVAELDIGCRCGIRAYFDGEKAASPDALLWESRDKKRKALEPVVTEAMGRIFDMQSVEFFKKLQAYL